MIIFVSFIGKDINSLICNVGSGVAAGGAGASAGGDGDAPAEAEEKKEEKKEESEEESDDDMGFGKDGGHFCNMFSIINYFLVALINRFV